jgi:cold-inducible RNA-binding protein
MDSKLYVGNLAYATTADDLRSLFAQAGRVTAVELMNDRASGQSKGFAFVTMSSAAEAQKAIGLFQGHALAGRDLKVNAARPREQPAASQAPTQEPAYRSKLGAFSATDRAPNAKPGPARPARGGGSGGYQSSLGAFGKGGKPAAPRRRGGGNRGG